MELLKNNNHSGNHLVLTENYSIYSLCHKEKLIVFEYSNIEKEI